MVAQGVKYKKADSRVHALNLYVVLSIYKKRRLSREDLVNSYTQKILLPCGS